ncbi:MAG: hypothetical protein L0Z73_12420 [Gammaproteobacteria bacterium]|nr:hypothetical protein [Gammaproteobacteria bacterium]
MCEVDFVWNEKSRVTQEQLPRDAAIELQGRIYSVFFHCAWQLVLVKKI